MKKLICLSFIALVALSGCITTRQCDARCQSRQIKDSVSVRDSIAWYIRDSTIFHEAKEGPTVTAKSPCDSVTGKLNAFDVTETKNGITTHLHSDGKTIMASCREEAYKLLLKNALVMKEAWHKAFRQVVYKEPCNLPHVNSYLRFCGWAFPVLIILILTYLYVKFKLRWLDKVLP